MSSIYLILLALHNWVRWLVLLTGVWALLKGGLALGQKRAAFASSDKAPFTAFMGSLHLQVLLGIAIFAVQGMTGIPTFPDASRGGFVWEHLGIGVLAAVFATLANRAAKAGAEAGTPELAAKAWRNATLWAVAAFIPLLLAIPWWRPMLRLFS